MQQWWLLFLVWENFFGRFEESSPTCIFPVLFVELQRRIQAMEMKCYCKIFHISFKDHVTNEEVRAKIQQASGPHEDFLTIVKTHKLQWYGPELSGEQGKMEETGCEIICGVPTTLAVKG